jgi:hypothetical protein
MGEYANYKGRSVKIGTCESMYYLRADQRHLVDGYDFSEDVLREIRFRFPWPHEDHIKPGDFDYPEHTEEIPGLTVPEGVDHYSMQFKADAGFLVSLPCPEQGREGIVSLTSDGSDHPYRVHANGRKGGAVNLVENRYWDGLLVIVAQCGGCGARWRYPTWEDAEPVVVALRSYADQQSGDRAEFLHTVADRITAGYGVTAETETEEVPA